jgi:hypothetical protein
VSGAYSSTTVPIAKSQEGIRKMIYAHQGRGLMLISHAPREGFEALMMINGVEYRVRIMATCKTAATHRGPGYRRRSGAQIEKEIEQEERRVWRVLYWHLKAVFESADAGVIDIRDVIMPYVVMPNGETLSERIVPQLEKVLADPNRALPEKIQ